MTWLKAGGSWQSGCLCLDLQALHMGGECVQKSFFWVLDGSCMADAEACIRQSSRTNKPPVVQAAQHPAPLPLTVARSPWRRLVHDLFWVCNPTRKRLVKLPSSPDHTLIQWKHGEYDIVHELLLTIRPRDGLASEERCSATRRHEIERESILTSRCMLPTLQCWVPCRDPGLPQVHSR